MYVMDLELVLLELFELLIKRAFWDRFSTRNSLYAVKLIHSSHFLQPPLVTTFLVHLSPEEHLSPLLFVLYFLVTRSDKAQGYHTYIWL
jgi:hypothetical protein